MDIYVQHLNMLLISFNKSSSRTSIMIWYGNAMYQYLVSVKHRVIDEHYICCTMYYCINIVLLRFHCVL